MRMASMFGGAGFTEAQEETISTLTEVSSWATLVGTFFILVSYLAFKELRHFHLRLIFFLAIADFCTAVIFIANLHVNINVDLTCTILGAILQFFELSSALWAFCIAFTLDQVIRVCNYHVEKYEKYFHLMVWGLAGTTTVVAGTQGLIVNTGLWCWVAGRDTGLFRWLFFYGPMILTLCYVTVVYILVSKKIRAQSRVSISVNNSETTIQQTFRWFIIGWIICWVPSCVDRIQGMFDPTNPVFVLSAMHAFFAPLSGFCNSIAIGFNDEIQVQYTALFWRFGVQLKTPQNLKINQKEETKLIQEIMREYDSVDQ